MIQLKIPDIGELELFFSKAQRFSLCQLKYKDKEYEIDMCEDYLYMLIENMLGRIQNLPIVEQQKLFGEMGKWQEYFYYSLSDNELHSTEISLMKKSIFISTEGYGTFLYKHNGNVWLEINRSYNEENGLSPIEFYSTPANYRILLAVISNKTLNEWENLLSEIKKDIADEDIFD